MNKIFFFFFFKLILFINIHALILFFFFFKLFLFFNIHEFIFFFFFFFYYFFLNYYVIISFFFFFFTDFVCVCLLVQCPEATLTQFQCLRQTDRHREDSAQLDSSECSLLYYIFKYIYMR